MKVSWDDDIPNMCNNNQGHVPVTTNQTCVWDIIHTSSLHLQNGATPISGVISTVRPGCKARVADLPEFRSCYFLRQVNFEGDILGDCL